MKESIVSWDRFEKAATVGGALGIAFAVMWYVWSIENRFGRIEAQIQAVVLSPAIGQAESGKSATSPIASACADLARRSADHHSKSEWTAASGIESLINKLNCPSIAKNSN